MYLYSVPIGFIYVQLPFHPAPQTLWPNLIWKNATGDYAGLFFRAEGGPSGGFGTVQADTCNRLSTVSSSLSTTFPPSSVTVPATGFSNSIFAGYEPTSINRYEVMSFSNSGEETRPRNTAVRIWERI